MVATESVGCGSAPCGLASPDVASLLPRPTKATGPPVTATALAPARAMRSAMEAELSASRFVFALVIAESAFSVP